MQHYLVRAGYVAALFVLMYTIGQATFGWQQGRNIGEIARFGSLVFQIFALVQLTLVLFFSLLFPAGNISQEKDRRTLILLLMTDLRNREMVLGKLAASLLTVGVLILASLPVFMAVHLLGGVTLGQILWSLALCAATALAAGSWGALVAFWREKTFQTLSISVLGVILYLGVLEAVIVAAGPESPVGRIASGFEPYRELLALLSPLSRDFSLEPVQVTALQPVLSLLGLAVVLNAISIIRLRVWNPSRFVFLSTDEDSAETTPTRKTPRQIWSNPVIWREIRTRAYGRKVAVIKLAYLLFAGFAVYLMAGNVQDSEKVMGMISSAGFTFVGLAIVSLMLLNAQAVTAMTSERDGATLELLLMTDVTAREFIFGKLGGVLYNSKELILVPLALVGYLAVRGAVSVEDAVYVIVGFLVLVCFAAMVGVHAGLTYDRSRSAIGNSLGTMFFLFVGIFIFMMLLVEARSSFFLQVPSFLVFIGAGSVGLYASLAHRNPSDALRIAAGALPFFTFYAITEFLRDGTLGVCLALTLAYGFATLAMLVPSISEFDVALGRTTLDKG